MTALASPTDSLLPSVLAGCPRPAVQSKMTYVTLQALPSGGFSEPRLLALPCSWLSLLWDGICYPGAFSLVVLAALSTLPTSSCFQVWVPNPPPQKAPSEHPLYDNKALTPAVSLLSLSKLYFPV